MPLPLPYTTRTTAVQQRGSKRCLLSQPTVHTNYPGHHEGSHGQSSLCARPLTSELRVTWDSDMQTIVCVQYINLKCFRYIVRARNWRISIFYVASRELFVIHLIVRTEGSESCSVEIDNTQQTSRTKHVTSRDECTASVDKSGLSRGVSVSVQTPRLMYKIEAS